MKLKEFKKLMKNECELLQVWKSQIQISNYLNKKLWKLIKE